MIKIPSHIPRRYILAIAGFLLVAIPYSIWLPRHTTSDSDYCLKCHGEKGGLPNRGLASKIHPSLKKVSCVDCHSKPGQIVYEGYVKGFMADVGQVTPNCMRCHEEILTKNTIDGFKYNVDKIGIPHKLHLKMGASCTDCHANVAHDLTDKPTNRPRMEYCSQCHATSTEPCAKCHLEKIPPGPIPTAPPAGLVGDGKMLFDKYCSSCHGMKGTGIENVNLFSKEFFDKYDVVTLRKQTLEGHKRMPSFAIGKGGGLSEDEVRAIIAHLKLSTAGIAVNGQALYDKYCAVCHGATGNKVASIDFSSALYSAKLPSDKIIKAIRVGKKGMPAFDKPHGGPLAFESIVTIAKYIPTLSADQATDITTAVDVVTLYRTHCAGCHGEGGNDVDGIHLTSAEYLKKLGDARFIKAVAKGTDAMPALGKDNGGELSNDEIGNILNYLKTKTGIITPSAESGKTAMMKAPKIPHEVTSDMEDCLECHGADGLKPVPRDHAGRTKKVCKTCHHSN